MTVTTTTYAYALKAGDRLDLGAGQLAEVLVVTPLSKPAVILVTVAGQPQPEVYEPHERVGVAL